MYFYRLAQRKQPGTPPGTPIHVGRPRAEPVRITVFDFTPDRLEVRECAEPAACQTYRGTPSVTWVDVDGIHDVARVNELGTVFGLHPLVLEDIVNTAQRPKVEEYEEYLYIVMKMLYLQDRTLELEQISIVLGPDYVLTFRERSGDLFDTVRHHIRTRSGRIRNMGADYLAYSLMDLIVDHYFVVLEQLAEIMDEVEDALLARPTPETLNQIYHLKRNGMLVRRVLFPVRDMVSTLVRFDAAVLHPATRVYYRDLYDHCMRAMEGVEAYRETVSDMVSVYLNQVSNRLNEIMKVLTLIATIFMPITFVTGVYGMNFRHMPELQWVWGYPAVLLLMLAVGSGMYRSFRRRGWW